MNKQRALMLGVTAAVVLAGGIILVILLYQLEMTHFEGRQRWNYTTWKTNDTTWETNEITWERFVLLPVVVIMSAFYLAFIISGLIGLIAAFFQNKCMYITTCIFTMLSLLIMALVVLISGFSNLRIVSSGLPHSTDCIDKDGMCQCRDSFNQDYVNSQFKTCAYVEKSSALAITNYFFHILTWVAALFEFVIACYFTCRNKATTGTVVTTPQQQPMLHSGPVKTPQDDSFQDDGPGYPPPGYDQDDKLPVKV